MKKLLLAICLMTGMASHGAMRMFDGTETNLYYYFTTKVNSNFLELATAEQMSSVGTTNATTTNLVLNCAVYTTWNVSVQTNTTISIRGLPNGYEQDVKVKLTQGIGSNTVSFASTLWAGGTPPTITVTSNSMDIVRLYSSNGGTNCIGEVVAQDVR